MVAMTPVIQFLAWACTTLLAGLVALAIIVGKIFGRRFDQFDNRLVEMEKRAEERHERVWDRINGWNEQVQLALLESGIPLRRHTDPKPRER